jgi:DNA-binding response OmpR family regulator
MGHGARRRIDWPARVVIIDSPSAPAVVHEREYRAVGVTIVRRPDAASALVELGHTDVDAVVVPTDVVGMTIVDFTDVVHSLTGAAVLVALAAESQREASVAALNAGARGIVALPLDPARLADELRHLAAQPRTLGEDSLDVTCGHVTLSSREHRVVAAGTEVRLSPKEFDILEYLMRVAPRAVRLHELVAVFGCGDSANNSRVRVTIAKIRSRVSAAAPGYPDIVQTIRGVGYRVSDRSADAHTNATD